MKMSLFFISTTGISPVRLLAHRFICGILMRSANKCPTEGILSSEQKIIYTRLYDHPAEKIRGTLQAIEHKNEVETSFIVN